MTPKPLSQSDWTRVATLRANIESAVPAGATQAIEQRARAAALGQLPKADRALLSRADEADRTRQAVADLAHSGRGAAIRAEIAEKLYRAEIEGSLAAKPAISEAAPRAVPPAAKAIATRSEPVASASAGNAEARGFAAGTARAVAVMSSYHFEGRVAQAAKLLCNAKLSADEITTMLADMPDGSGAAMLAAIRGRNPNLGTGGATEQTEPSAANNHGWAAIHARVRAEKNA